MRENPPRPAPVGKVIDFGALRIPVTPDQQVSLLGGAQAIESVRIVEQRREMVFSLFAAPVTGGWLDSVAEASVGAVLAAHGRWRGQRRDRQGVWREEFLDVAGGRLSILLVEGRRWVLRCMIAGDPHRHAADLRVGWDTVLASYAVRGTHAHPAGAALSLTMPPDWEECG